MILEGLIVTALVMTLFAALAYAADNFDGPIRQRLDAICEKVFGEWSEK